MEILFKMHIINYIFVIENIVKIAPYNPCIPSTELNNIGTNITIQIAKIIISR